MLSNKDIRVENGNLVINGVKYPLDTIEIKEEVDALDDRVTALETTTLEHFNVTLAAALGTPNTFDEECYYNPITKEVTLRIMIYSSDALIPVDGNPIFTVPTKYRPSSNIQLGMATLISSDGWNTRLAQVERCYLATNGTFCLNNFVYGPKPTKIFYLYVSYIAA